MHDRVCVDVLEADDDLVEQGLCGGRRGGRAVQQGAEVAVEALEDEVDAGAVDRGDDVLQPEEGGRGGEMCVCVCVCLCVCVCVCVCVWIASSCGVVMEVW